jgi:hypothetical protein
MEATVAEVGASVKTAVDSAAKAYDELIKELKKAKPDSTVVLGRSGVVLTSSLKVWANLMLAPAKIAAVITSDEA